MIRLMGKIVDNGKTVGYAIIDMDSNKGAMCNIDTTKTYVHTIGCVNAKLENGELVGTEASLNRLPEFNTSGALVDSPKVSITGSLEKDGVIIGFIIMTPTGAVAKLTYDKTIEAINKYGSTNAKLVPKDGKTIVSAIQGTFEVMELNSAKEIVKKAKIQSVDYEKLSRENDFVFKNCSYNVLEKAYKNKEEYARYAFPNYPEINRKAMLNEFTGTYANDKFVILNGSELGIPGTTKGFKVILVDSNNKAISRLEFRAITSAIARFNKLGREIRTNLEEMSKYSGNKEMADIYGRRLSSRHGARLVSSVKNGYMPEIIKEAARHNLTNLNRRQLQVYTANRLESLAVPINPVISVNDFIGNPALFQKMNKISNYWNGRKVETLWGTVNAYDLYNISEQEVKDILNYYIHSKINFYNKPRIGILMDNYDKFDGKLPIINEMIEVGECNGAKTYREKKLAIGNNLTLNDLVILVMLGNKDTRLNAFLHRMNRELLKANLPGLDKIIVHELKHAISRDSKVRDAYKALTELDNNGVLKTLTEI